MSVYIKSLIISSVDVSVEGIGLGSGILVSTGKLWINEFDKLALLEVALVGILPLVEGVEGTA